MVVRRYQQQALGRMRLKIRTDSAGIIHRTTCRIRKLINTGGRYTGLQQHYFTSLNGIQITLMLRRPAAPDTIICQNNSGGIVLFKQQRRRRDTLFIITGKHNNCINPLSQTLAIRWPPLVAKSCHTHKCQKDKNADSQTDTDI